MASRARLLGSQLRLIRRHISTEGQADQQNVPGLSQFKVYRFNPEDSKPPRMEQFDIDRSECGPMILDALFHIKDTLDSSLSFRRSCREGICGSCAMNINGKNGLACLTEIPPLQNGPIEVRPLPNMYSIRDLVVDMSLFFNQYKSIQPFLRRKTISTTGSEVLQSREDRAKLDGLYECILCACCTTSCPSYWWNPEAYLGPAALLQSYRWIADSRDECTAERLSNMNDTMKLYRCHGIMNCSACCPKGLDPATAIQRMKDLISKNFSEEWINIRAANSRLDSKPNTQAPK